MLTVVLIRALNSNTVSQIFASDDQSVIEFQLYIQHLKEEASKIDRDMATLAQLTDDLKRMTTRAGCVSRSFAALISLQNLLSRFAAPFYLQKSQSR